MKTNNNIPAYRFQGYTDAWELRKLGEVMEVTSVKRIHQSDWTDFGVRFLRARDIVAESKNESVSEPLFISQKNTMNIQQFQERLQKVICLLLELVQSVSLC